MTSSDRCDWGVFSDSSVWGENTVSRYIRFAIARVVNVLMLLCVCVRLCGQVRVMIMHMCTVW